MLTEGFFHADPHPGQPALERRAASTCSTSGWSGSLDDDTRGLLLLMLLAFWREDSEFLADVLLMLGEGGHDVDIEGLRADLADYVGQFKVGSFSDIELGPMLDTLIEIAARHGIRLPASLAMTGKAFGQMQLAVAELDPTLDPFSAVGGFMFRGLRERVGGALDPQKAIYEIQKLKVRATRLIEGIERLTGARPGPGLQIELRGSQDAGGRDPQAGRRIALAFAGGRGAAGRRPGGRRLVDRPLGAGHARRRRRRRRPSRSCSTSAGARSGAAASARAAPGRPRAASSTPR